MPRFFIKFVLATFLIVFLIPSVALSSVTVIPTDATQSSLYGAYNFAASKGYVSFRGWGEYDPSLATEYGEIPILWNNGNFLWPDTLNFTRPFSNFSGSAYSTSVYSKSYSLSIPGSNSIVILKGSVLDTYGQSCTWQYAYYTGLLQQMDISSSVYTTYIDSNVVDFPWNTRLLIIPAFNSSPGSLGVYMDETVARYPDLGIAIQDYLAGGGTIYAEGNGGYLLEAYGILPVGSVQLDDYVDGELSGLCEVEVKNPDHPLGYQSASDGIYTIMGPTFSVPGMDTILAVASSWDSGDIGKPLTIEIAGASASGGKILLCSGMPTTGILAADDANQWQWTINAILSAFSEKMMNVRSVFTDADIDSTDIAPIALPVMQSDTFEVTIRVRNLWDDAIDNVSVVEEIDDIYEYVGTSSGPSPSSVSSPNITYDLGTIPAGGEVIITYQLRTPDSDDVIWENLDNYVDRNSYADISSSILYFDDPESGATRWVYRNSIKAKFLFEAEIVADTDLNWKNILGEYFQPFKMFTILENKERTSALGTKYVQYIPLDVPIYWVDPMAIPIIRTPGGKFVDVLQGWYDENRNGEVDAAEIYHDIEGDGDPDAWLDVNTMHPVPDTMIYEEIYWYNPWHNEYEDIDHDGIHPVDSDDDGIFEIEDPGDKIRALRCEWKYNLDPFPGYGWFDPYASWELWIDPPPLVAMALGVAEAAGSLTVDIDTIPEISDEPYYYDNWQHWMEYDSIADEIIWKRLVYVHFGSYEGFVFIDDGDAVPDPNAIDVGHVPWPRREYIAVLNLGGEEPTMTDPTCDSSLYSWVEYNTIWGKPKKTPIRVSYTYYTPLPNPLQFEYISCAYKITDPISGTPMNYLPKNGEADLSYQLCASTEYSRYWLKVVGQDWGTFDFDYDGEGRGWFQTSPTGDGLGDGVVGYMVHEIPKGIGGYEIDLPRDAGGAIDIDALVDGFFPYMHHDSVGNEIVVTELPFKYEILIPQILIPPALDDDDLDGNDDWDDDFGDRFVSSTGYLHDIFPPMDGEDAEGVWFGGAEWDTITLIEGDLAQPHIGWCPGPDSTYGDDLCEHLGETRLTVHAHYTGKGREGSVEINKGVWLVNEEIFGGSPWVQWSHAQFAYAKGHSITMGRSATPSVIPLHPDTVLMRWCIAEWDEPDTFDFEYDPYLDGNSNGEVTIITHAGGREPASLFDTDVYWNAQIDPLTESATVTALPLVTPDDSVPGYPRTETGSFLQIVVEVDNTSGKHWYQTTITPDLSGLMTSEMFLNYGCYPRPFVPQHVEFDPVTGEPNVVSGDDPRTLTAGWRFNPSAEEVLFAIGESDGSVMIPEIQASRRGYFIYHIKIDPNLPVGVYEIPFTLSANAMDYIDPPPGIPVSMEVPSAKFAIVRRSGATITDKATLVNAVAELTEFATVLQKYVMILNPSSDVRWGYSMPTMDNWSVLDPTGASVVDTHLTTPLPAEVGAWPSIYHNYFWIGAKAIVDAPYAADDLDLDYGADLAYNDFMGLGRSTGCSRVSVTSRGASMRLTKVISEVNGIPVDDDGYFYLEQGTNELVIDMIATNIGNDIAYDIAIEGQLGEDAEFVTADSTYPFDYNETSKTINWPDFAHIPPGVERQIPVTISVERTEGDDLLELFYAFAIEFYDSIDQYGETQGIRYRPEHTDTLFYGMDLFFEEGDLSCAEQDIEVDDEITLNAKVRIDGNMEAKNVVVRFFDGEEQIASDQVIVSMVPADSFAVVSVPFTVNQDYHLLYAMTDPDSLLGELDESNNLAMLELVSGKGDPLDDVINFPNPFKDYTEFTYVLNKLTEEVIIKVFTVRGRPVRVFDNCPTSIGYNSVGWDGSDSRGDQIANGTYIYKVIAKTDEGVTHEITERIVRMR